MAAAGLEPLHGKIQDRSDVLIVADVRIPPGLTEADIDIDWPRHICSCMLAYIICDNSPLETYCLSEMKITSIYALLPVSVNDSIMPLKYRHVPGNSHLLIEELYLMRAYKDIAPDIGVYLRKINISFKHYERRLMTSEIELRFSI